MRTVAAHAGPRISVLAQGISCALMYQTRLGGSGRLPGIRFPITYDLRGGPLRVPQISAPGWRTMQDTRVDIPAEILTLLQGSHLSSRPPGEQVTAALAIHLFMEGLISVGKAAELAGESRVDFEWLLSQMGLPVVSYDVPDYEQDLKAFSEAEHRSAS